MIIAVCLLSTVSLAKISTVLPQCLLFKQNPHNLHYLLKGVLVAPGLTKSTVLLLEVEKPSKGSVQGTTGMKI